MRPEDWRADPSDRVEREVRLQRVLDDCINRRIAGEPLTADEILESYPDLLPELRDRLRHLEIIERARRRAGTSSLAAGRLPAEAEPAARPARSDDLFPGYDVYEEIHRGAQGVVYRARQRATGRVVAIKVIREGEWASRRELARFEREVQILAELRHPNIVTVHDRGETAGGSAFIVMDHIAGRTLDEALAGDDAENPPRGAELERRLALAGGVCEALAAAHLHGVIHRDIKPGNILIDEAGEPHVLDFGLARRTAPAGEIGAAAMTMTGQFVGSAAWASPEQAAGAADVDLRSDVYSLGVLMYRMFSGRMPYSIDGALPDVLERVRVAPPEPLRRVNPDVDADLETIVLKCLAKDRARRYDSAAALAADLRRRAAGEPIEARRESTAYVLRMLMRRHRVAVRAFAAVAVVILASVVVLGVLYQRQRAATLLAQIEAEKSAAVIELFQDLLGSANPQAAKGPDYPVRELLDEFSLTVWDRLAEQPQVEATIRQTLGNAYRELSVFDKAETHLRRALDLHRRHHGESSLETAAALADLAWLHLDRDEWDAAEDAARTALRIRSALDGGAGARVAASEDQIGMILQHRGSYAEAEAWHREALDLFEAVSPRPTLAVARVFENLALARQHQGDYPSAVAHYRAALEALGERLPDGHPRVNAARLNYASVLRAMGRYADAETVLRQVLAAMHDAYEDDHPAVAETRLLLGTVLRLQGRLEEAESILRAALAAYEVKYPEGHVAVGITLNALGNVLREAGRRDESVAVSRRALEVRKRVGGPRHPGVVSGETNLALALWAAGRPEEALTHSESAVSLCRSVYGESHPRLAAACYAHGRVLLALEHAEQAAAALNESLAIRHDALPAGHIAIGETLAALAVAKMQLGAESEARAVALEAQQILSARLADNDWRMLELAALLASDAESLASAAERLANLRGATAGVAAWAAAKSAPAAHAAP